MKRYLVYALLTSLFSFTASANAKIIGNGGYVIQCPGSELLVLDYYEATLPTINGTPELLPFDEAHLNETKTIFDKRIATIPDFYTSILSRYQDISNYEDWILVNLAPANDDTNVVYHGCDKPTRAAFRQNSVVYLQERVLSKLSSGQLFILGLHEWFYESSKFSTSLKEQDILFES